MTDVVDLSRSNSLTDPAARIKLEHEVPHEARLEHGRAALRNLVEGPQ